MPIIIPYKTDEEWLEHKSHDISSTEVSALFGENSYQTEYELWHRKKNGLVLAWEETERTKWGKRYEAPTADGLAEDNGWKIKPLKVYMRSDKVKGMGSSFDYEIEEDGKLGILEIKTTDYKEYKSKWLTEGDETEAPIQIELQLQHQLEVANRSFGYIAVMVGGNKPVVIRRERDREMGELICKKIEQFWASVDAGIEPTPDYLRDGEVIKMLYADVSGDEIDLSDNKRFHILLDEYAKYQSDESAANKNKEASKNEMIVMMGTAGVVKCGQSYVTRKTVTRKAYEVKESKYVDMRVKQVKNAE